MSQDEAYLHVPTNPTYVIRILMSGQIMFNAPFKPLKDSSLYRAVREYVFDDVWPGIESSRDILFSPNIAEEMLKDFVMNRNQCSDLLVHCSRGINRSPAVAIAFNDIFSLGANSDEFRMKYPQANWFVYNSLINEARRLGAG